MHIKKFAAISRLIDRVDWKIAIKLGITASLTLFLTTRFDYLSGSQNKIIAGMWSVVAALYIIQTNIGGSYQIARTRVLAIFTGSALGAFFTALFGAENLSLGVSVSCNVIICYLLGLKDSIYLSSISLVVVNILWKLNPAVTPWEFGFFRIVDSAIGIVIGLAVAHYIWPAKAVSNLRLNLSKTFLTLSELYRIVSDFDLPITQKEPSYLTLIGKVYELQKENKDFLGKALLEMGIESERKNISSLVELSQELFQSIVVLRPLFKSRISEVFDAPLKIRLKLLNEEISRQLCAFSDFLQEKNNHLPFAKLKDAIEKFNIDLTRFRTTRITRSFEIAEVEGFYFFLYSVKSLCACLQRIERLFVAGQELS